MTEKPTTEQYKEWDEYQARICKETALKNGLNEADMLNCRDGERCSDCPINFDGEY